MLLHKHDQCKTFNVDGLQIHVDGLQIHEAGPLARNNQCMQDNKPNWINSTIWLMVMLSVGMKNKSTLKLPGTQKKSYAAWSTFIIIN
jgi:hypothetical protein